MKTLTFILIFLSPPFLKTALLRWFCHARIAPGVHIGWFTAISAKRIKIGKCSEIRALSIIRCKGEFAVGDYSIISSMVLVYGAEGLRLGDRCYIGPQSLINVDRQVRFGNVSAIGPRSMIFTHGSFLPYTEGYWTKMAGVTVGDYVWMAAGVFVQPGVEIGSHVFVNSRSVVTRSVADGQVVAGNPAQPVATLDRMTRTMTPKRVDTAAKQMLHHFADAVLQQQMGLEVRNHTGQFRFRYHNHDYLMACVDSQAQFPANGELDPKTRYLLLVNRPGWHPPDGRAVLWFDLTHNRTIESDDALYCELRDFMRMYFGVIFERQD